MEPTTKQSQEIEYYENTFKFKATEEEIKEFIDYTVFGIKNLDRKSNRLFQSKRRLEITYKLWKEDFNILITKQELIEDAKEKGNFNPFFERLVNSLDFTK